MKKKYFIAFLFICFVFSAHAGIAVVDIDKVITNSIAYKKFKVQWDNDNLKYQHEISSCEKKMIDLDKEIRSLFESSNTTKVNELKTELSNQEMNIQKLIERRKNMLDRAFSSAIAQIKSHMMKVIEKNASENNFEIVMSKSQAIYSNAKYDITEMILQELNSRIKRVSYDIEGAQK